MGAANWSPIIMPPPLRPRRAGGGGGAAPAQMDEEDRLLVQFLASIAVSLCVALSLLISWGTGNRAGEEAAWAEAFAARQAHWEPYEYTYKGRVKTASRRVLGPARCEAPPCGAR